MFDASPLPYEPIDQQRSLSPKLSGRALFHDRLKALGAFTGIAIGAIAGLEMVIGGGFDFMTPSPEVREVAPSRYVTVQQVPWSSQMEIIQLYSTEPLFSGDFTEVQTASNDLAGGYDDVSAPTGGYPDISEDRVRADISSLYSNNSSYREAGITYQDAPAIDESQAAAPDPYAEAEAMVRQAMGVKDEITLQPS